LPSDNLVIIVFHSYPYTHTLHNNPYPYALRNDPFTYTVSLRAYN